MSALAGSKACWITSIRIKETTQHFSRSTLAPNRQQTGSKPWTSPIRWNHPKPAQPEPYSNNSKDTTAKTEKASLTISKMSWVSIPCRSQVWMTCTQMCRLNGHQSRKDKYHRGAIFSSNGRIDWTTSLSSTVPSRQIKDKPCEYGTALSVEKEHSKPNQLCTISEDYWSDASLMLSTH